MSKEDEIFEQLVQLVSDEKYSEALQVAYTSQKTDVNNYELYYIRALCQEQMGMVEDAYFSYKMALYLGRDSSQKEVLQQGFQNLCSYAGANSYELGKACERLIVERIKNGEFSITHSFLSEQLYDTNRAAAKVVLSEENMLLFMMLEIVLCERNRLPEREFFEKNTCKGYACDVRKFIVVYRQVKFMIRRIWFGFDMDSQKVLNQLLRRYDISSDMLAVIAKYSVRQEFWKDTFMRLQAVVQYQHPQYGIDIGGYIQWMDGQNLGKQERCRLPASYANDGALICLDYNEEYRKENHTACGAEVVRTQNLNANKIAVIFCTNDSVYESECVAYLRRLRIPEGKQLEIIEVWNAPGMAAGYNVAMMSTDAKYKIYIHHDTFLLEQDILTKLVDVFSVKDALGMIEIFGSIVLQDSALWYRSSWEESRLNLYQHAVLEIHKSVSEKNHGMMEYAEAIDGVFIATARDVFWREDLFDGWHFYDISQGYEFRKYGFETEFYIDSEIWALHETTMKKDPHDTYEMYRKVFQREYLGQGGKNTT